MAKPLVSRNLVHFTMFLLLVIASRAPAFADPAAETFRQSCMSCHTIGGGRLVGPDLKDVSKRADRDWLTKFIVNPKGVLDSGDPYALKLKDEARGAIMPPIAGMTPVMAAQLLDMIERESKLPKSQFVGLSIGDQPFTATDVQLGHDLFTGDRLLSNGGPACVSCHAVRGLKSLGGGRLGPDLTRVYERLQGRKGLAAWMLAPATQTMRPLFLNRAMTNDEIVALVAFFESEAKKGGAADNTPQLTFALLGFGGAIFGFVGADAIWRRRFRGVRRPLVRGDK